MKRVVLCTTGNHPVVEALLQSRHQLAAFIDFGKPESRLSKQRAVYHQLQERVLNNPKTAAAVCRHHGIPYHHVPGTELATARQLVKRVDADIMVVAQAPILPRSFFTLLPEQAINLHPSKLPDYRGADPFFWMAVDQVNEAAATVHLLTENVDQGDILAQATLAVEPGLTESRLKEIAVRELGAPLIIKVLDSLDEFKKTCRPQPAAGKRPTTRVVTPKNIHDVIDLGALSLDQAWNVLRFTEDWPDMIDGTAGPRKLYRWEVLGHDRLVPGRNHLDPGAPKLEKRQGRWFYRHPEGDIELRSKLNLGAFIKSRIV